MWKMGQGRTGKHNEGKIRTTVTEQRLTIKGIRKKKDTSVFTLQVFTGINFHLHTVSVTSNNF